jgi:hypothetical protein
MPPSWAAAATDETGPPYPLSQSLGVASGHKSRNGIGERPNLSREREAR